MAITPEEQHITEEQLQARELAVVQMYEANKTIAKGDYDFEKPGKSVAGIVEFRNGKFLGGVFEQPNLIYAASLSNPFIMHALGEMLKVLSINPRQEVIRVPTMLQMLQYTRDLEEYIRLRGNDVTRQRVKLAARRIRNGSNLQLTFEEACILALGRSDGSALRLAKQDIQRRAMERGSWQTLLDHIVAQYVPSLELTRDVRTIAYQDAANSANPFELAQGFDKLVAKYREDRLNRWIRPVIGAMTNSPMDWGFDATSQFRDHTVIEKVGLFPLVNFVPALAGKEGGSMPVHNIALSLATVFDNAHNRHTVLSYVAEEVALPHPSEHEPYGFDNPYYQEVYLSKRMERTKQSLRGIVHETILPLVS